MHQFLKSKNIILMLIVFGTIFALNSCKKQNIKKPKTVLGNLESPNEAFEETTKALNLLSKNINTGKQNLKYIKEFEKSKNLVFKKINNK